jgi:hypothetical protein
MIVGTEGGKDYLVIAEHNGFVLGLKPLLLISMDNSQYGFRLRMQRAETDKPDIENKQATLAKMDETFSEVPWSKRSSTRFSTVILADCSYGVEFLDKVESETLAGFGKLVDSIVERIAPVEVNDPVDMVNFITERYTTMIEEIRKAWAEHNAPAQKKESDVADVLSFPSKGDDVE